jgi:hypothetical protein
MLCIPLHVINMNILNKMVTYTKIESVLHFHALHILLPLLQILMQQVLCLDHF